MAYLRPVHDAVDFGRTGSYTRPVDYAVDLTLADGGGPTIVYQTPPGVTHRIGARWQLGQGQGTVTALRHQDAPPRDRHRRSGWGAGQARSSRWSSHWGRGHEQDADAKALAWRTAPAHQSAVSGRWSAPPARDIDGLKLRWSDARPRDPARLDAPWGTPGERDLLVRPAWRVVQWHRRRVDAFHAYQRPAHNVVLFALDGDYERPEGNPLTLALAPGLHLADALLIPRNQTWRLPWGNAYRRNLVRELPWGWGQSAYRKDRKIDLGYPDTTQPPLVLPEPGDDPTLQETYITMNLVTIKRLSDDLPIDMRDLTLSLDVDSWAWRLSGTVLGLPAMQAIAPSISGPVDIEVSLNGHRWIFMIEQYSGSTGFADQRYQVQGVSRTQYMAPPYAPVRSKTNAAQVNAVQAASEELQYTGFLLDWNTLPGDTTPDWTYPVGAFSYQGQTPAEVIQAIAASAGAVLIPHRDADGWVLQPRLRAMPWDLAGSYMNAIVHHSQVTRYAEQWQPAPLYNAAFVSGVHYGHGVSASRYGSAGDQPAADLFDPAIVAHDQAVARAKQQIAASGNRAVIDIETAIPEVQVAPGLIEPGDLLEFQGAGETWRGYVLGVTINAPGSGTVSLKQTARALRLYEH